MSKQTYSCGLEAALDVVGGKWKVIILWHLLRPKVAASANFGAKVAGISEKMLIQKPARVGAATELSFAKTSRKCLPGLNTR